MISKLSPIQKERVQRLENALAVAASKGNLNTAKAVVKDLKSIFDSTGNSARYLQAKIRLYEAGMEADMLASAESGLISIRVDANNNTRTYLEASVMLAICYLRMKNLAKAEPVIKEVLVNDKVITSPGKRAEFRKNIIDRFDQEGLLFALRDNTNRTERMDPSEIEAGASELIRKNLNEEELFENMGKEIPTSAKNILSRIDNFSKKQLPSAERLALPSGAEMVKDKKVGETIYHAIKRVLYKSVCDPDSEVYKGWYSYGITGVTSVLTTIVADTFHKLNISIRLVIVSVAAWIIKFSLAVFCEHNKPKDVMALR